MSAGPSKACAATPALALLAVLLPALLVGCRGPAPEPPPLPEPVPAPPPVVAPAPPPPDFCPALARIVEAERDGYASLRAGRGANAVWLASVQPAGLTDCRIEGDYWPAATYVCRLAGARSESAQVLRADFDGFARAVDACLERPYWHPRLWQRGRVMELARGERFLQWHDNSRLPRPILVLKIEEDIRARRFDVLLRVQTFR
jgi:hypothetical protein